MYINYFNAVEDSLDLASLPIPPDDECQPIGANYTVPPACEPYVLPHCPPCPCSSGDQSSQAVSNKKAWNIFWVVVGITAAVSLFMGGEDDSLTGGPLQ